MGAGSLVIAAGAFVLINRRHPRFLAGIKPTQLALCYFANPSRDLQRPEKDIGHLAAAAAGDDRRASRGKIAEGLYVFQTKGLDKYQVGGGRALRRIQSRRDKNKDEALALIRSDLGEALEALRTGGMDDELPIGRGSRSSWPACSSASSNTPGPTSSISTEPSARGSPTRRPRSRPALISRGPRPAPD